MLKNAKNNGTEEIGLVTPTPGSPHKLAQGRKPRATQHDFAMLGYHNIGFEDTDSRFNCYHQLPRSIIFF